MATESTEPTDPHTPLCLGPHPSPHCDGFGLVAVCTLDEIMRWERSRGETREKNTQNRVVAGFSVGSVDSVAIRGGAEGPASSLSS